MFCENCGSQIPDGSAICPNCGAAARVSPTTGEAVPVQPIEAVPVQPVQPVYQQPIQPVYQQPAYQSTPIYQQPAAGGGSKALAIVALVLGISALVFCWVPIFGSLIAVAGLICGIISLKNPNGKGMGLTGMILSIVACVLSFMMIVSILAGGSSYNSKVSSYSRSLSRSRSRASSLSRSISLSKKRKNQNAFVSLDKELSIGGYTVTF